MLQNLKHLYGRHLDALDGEIGQVKDFLFDDRTWTIRYVLAATHDWLDLPQVRLATEAFEVPLSGTPRQGGVSARVQLTRAQIEAGSAIAPRGSLAAPPNGDATSSATRPDYWSGDGAWSGASGPLHEVPAEHAGNGPALSDDPHLQSTLALLGSRVLATDAPLGTVVGFVTEGHTWSIRQIVAETGPWYSRETILLERDQVARIHAADSTVSLNLTASECRHAPGAAPFRGANGVH